MPVLRSFRDLIVYKRSVRAARSVFEMSRGFPADERFSLTDQVRRSSRAVGAMLAEAWAKRRYRASFISKVNDALGEAMETQSWLDHALCCKYIDRATYNKHDDEWQQIGAMLNGMIEEADSFCRVA